MNQVPRAEGERVKQQELELGIGLIDQMSNDQFEPEKYHDEYRLRVLALIEEKMKTGKEITAPPEPTIRKPGAPVISLMEALKQSMRKAAPTQRPARPCTGRKEGTQESIYRVAIMPGTVEESRGFTINWDVTEVPETGRWKGTGAVILPPDASQHK